MLGPLCRYLRMLGYDTLDANAFEPGNPAEDSMIIRTATDEDRIILTRDRELVRRSPARAHLIMSPGVIDQVRYLAGLGLITPDLLLTRCPLCNSELRPAGPRDIQGARYAPKVPPESGYTWCDRCSRLYWGGSHCARMEKRLRLPE